MIRLLIPAVLLMLLAGCKPGPSDADVEKAVREGMRAQHGVELVSFELKKGDGGRVTGFATDAKGTRYAVEANPAGFGKFEWKAEAVLGVAEIERKVTEGMLEQMKVRFVSMSLVEEPKETFTGTAKAENDDEYEIAVVLRGGLIDWKAIPGRVWVERFLRAGLRDQLRSDVASLNLTRSSPGHFSGRAVLKNGTKLDVSTFMEGRELRWKGELAKSD